MKTTQSIAPIMALGVAFGSSASAALINLTAANSSGGVNGALFTTTEIQSAGTGVIDPFVRLSRQGNNTTAEGFNANARPVMADVNSSPTFTHDLQLSMVSLVNVLGTNYYQFLLDINQNASDPLLSLDELEIYTRPTALLTASSTAALAGSALRYDLDAGADSTILLNYSLNSSGSGAADMFAYIPASAFGATTDYVYLYSQFGATGGAYADNDGYQEWASRSSTVTRVPDGGTTFTLLGLALGGIAMARRATSKSPAIMEN
jgi:VPDSG-CTERM motif